MNKAATSITLATDASVARSGNAHALLPWRDPHTVPPGTLAAYIAKLERACTIEPRSAELQTCLGVAYAMNYDVDKSMASLEEAVVLDPNHFWARLKLAELHYRLRILNRAEEETLKALELADNHWQFAAARKQLQEIRALLNGCVRNVQWTKPLTVPAVTFSALMILLFVVMLWK